MIDLIVENRTVFFDVYVKIAILIYTMISSCLYAYWLKPFVACNRAANIAGILYLLLSIPNVLFDTTAAVWRMFPILIIGATIFASWYLDGKRNPIQKVFLGIVFSLISWVTAEIFSEIGFYEREIVFRFDIFRSSVTAVILEFCIWNIIFYSGALMLLYVGIKLLHHTYRTKSDELTRQEFIMLLVPSLSFLAVKPIVRSYMLLWMDGIGNGSIKENIPGDPYRILFDVLSYFSILILITFYERNKERQEEVFARKALTNQIEDNHRYVERVERMYENMRAMRHDMGNHISVIAQLVEKGETDELTDYMKRWQGDFAGIQSKVKTGNAVTDVVISDFAERAKKEDISFECTYVYPDKLDINPFDMSVVLTNALSNAFEAARSAAVKRICVTSVKKDNVFLVNVRNTERDKALINEDGLPQSTKEASGHGYGLKNIQSIARKYKGDIEIRQEHADRESWFVLNVMLIG